MRPFPVFCGHTWRRSTTIGGPGLWFRFFGYGLLVKLWRKGDLVLFSERYGYKGVLAVGPIKIEVLRP